jgi:hypothetical protein
VNWATVGAIAELLGAIAVIVTLVYLAIQIRQNSSVVRTSNYWQLTGQMGEFSNQLAADPELLAIYQNGLRSYADLSGLDRGRFHMLLSTLFTKFQVMVQLQRRGQLDRELYEEQFAGFAILLESPGIREWWAEEGRWFAAPFRSYIDRRISRPAA